MAGEDAFSGNQLVDSHCHLDYLQKDGDLDEALARANRAGIGTMVTICTKISEFSIVRDIAATHYAPVFYAAGTHPMNADKEPMATVNELITLAGHPKLVAIGETGLDYHYTVESAEVQKQSLRIHIQAAQATKLPLIIHSRSADQDMTNILQSEFKNAPFSCVMHCFSSSPELGKVALDLGFYLSMSGIATFPKSHELREIFTYAPLDRVLVETDAPYLAPPPFRGKRNEPAYVVHTAETLAKVKRIDAAELATATTKNFYRLFNKATPNYTV